MERTCRRCKRKLPKNEFYRDTPSGDGHMIKCIVGQCGECRAQIEERKREMEFVKEKTCRLCKRKLPTNEFYQGKPIEDGHTSEYIMSQCGKCRAQIVEGKLRREDARCERQAMCERRMWKCSFCDVNRPWTDYKVSRKNGYVRPLSSCISCRTNHTPESRADLAREQWCFNNGFNNSYFDVYDKFQAASTVLKESEQQK
jgi:hypothetical protein